MNDDNPTFTITLSDVQIDIIRESIKNVSFMSNEYTKIKNNLTFDLSYPTDNTYNFDVQELEVIKVALRVASVGYQCQCIPISMTSIKLLHVNFAMLDIDSTDMSISDKVFNFSL